MFALFSPRHLGYVFGYFMALHCLHKHRRQPVFVTDIFGTGYILHTLSGMSGNSTLEIIDNFPNTSILGGYW